MPIKLEIRVETFPLAHAFVIARGARTEAVVVSAHIGRDGLVGRGECVPYARYGESVESVTAAMETARDAIEADADRQALQTLLPAGAARNALDCAMWDLESKRAGVRAHVLAGFETLAPATTAFTLSLGEPAAMGAAAARESWRPLLKVKLGGAGDPARIAAVRARAPRATLIVDANESWREADLEENLDACAKAGVALVEQPLPAGADEALARTRRALPVCADESAHDRKGLEALRERYDAVNIKLDKTGGLTEALLMAAAAEKLGFALFVGCMVGTSLAMAPAMLLTPRARFVDLDGPLLLARDREPGLRYEGSLAHPPEAQLWG